MHAIHLPGVPDGQTPPYSFPAKQVGFWLGRTTHAYLISVTATALTRGELTWDEILDESRFHPHGGAVPGHDIVGTVHTVYPSSNDTNPPKLKAGDKVWGLLDFDRDGAAATIAIAYEDELALVPEAPNNISQEQWESQLATLPLSALTAFQSMFDHGNVSAELLTTTMPTVTQSSSDISSSRPRVLILGPTGSVGLPTLYLALAASLDTVVLTSSHHISFLDGIDRITDASSSLNTIMRDDPSHVDLPTSFNSHSPPIPPADVVIDTVGGQTLQDLLLSPSLSTVIRAGGKVVTLVAPVKAFGADVEKQVTENCKKCEVEVDFFIVKPNSAQLSTLGDLARQGKLVGHVDAVFPLEEGREAMEMVEGKRGVGKVVLKVDG